MVRLYSRGDKSKFKSEGNNDRKTIKESNRAEGRGGSFFS